MCCPNHKTGPNRYFWASGTTRSTLCRNWFWYNLYFEISFSKISTRYHLPYNAVSSNFDLSSLTVQRGEFCQIPNPIRYIRNLIVVQTDRLQRLNVSKGVSAWGLRAASGDDNVRFICGWTRSIVVQRVEHWEDTHTRMLHQEMTTSDSYVAQPDWW